MANPLGLNSRFADELGSGDEFESRNIAQYIFHLYCAICLDGTGDCGFRVYFGGFLVDGGEVGIGMRIFPGSVMFAARPDVPVLPIL